MKNILTNIGILAMVGVSALTTSCRESFDYEDAYRANPEFVYRENFEKAFGKIDPNQSWDFTESNFKMSSTRAGESEYLHVGLSEDVKANNSGFFSSVFTKLPEENQLNSSSFNFQSCNSYPLQSKGDFYVLPVYRGVCDKEFSLLVIGTAPSGTQTIIEIPWSDIAKGIAGGSTGVTNNNSIAQGSYGVTYGAKMTFAPGTIITFATKEKDEEPVSNYLCAHGVSGQKIFTGNTNGYEQVLIFNSDGDNDYNDLIVWTCVNEGGTPPIVVEGGTIEGSVDKRYMVEDLGAVDGSDIDFNDIVIDLHAKSTITFEETRDPYTNQVISRTPSDPVFSDQNAKVIALGGTLNIAVVVGDKQIFQKQGNYDVKSMYQTGDPGTEGASWSDYSTNVMKEIDLNTTDFNNPWVPSENNITVLVGSNNGDLDDKVDLSAQNAVRRIDFPDNGTLPFMVATPVSQKFNAEKCSVLEAGSADMGYYFYLGGQ